MSTTTVPILPSAIVEAQAEMAVTTPKAMSHPSLSTLMGPFLPWMDHGDNYYTYGDGSNAEGVPSTKDYIQFVERIVRLKNYYTNRVSGSEALQFNDLIWGTKGDFGWMQIALRGTYELDEAMALGIKFSLACDAGEVYIHEEMEMEAILDCGVLSRKEVAILKAKGLVEEDEEEEEN